MFDLFIKREKKEKIKFEINKLFLYIILNLFRLFSIKIK